MHKLFVTHITCVAIMICLLTAGIPVFAKDICNTLPKPQSIFHGMGIEKFKRYEDERLGIGLTYSTEKERLSIFRFDYGFEKIDDEILKKFSSQAVSDIHQAAKMVGEEIKASRELSIIPFSSFSIHNYFLMAFNQGEPKFEFLGMGHDERCVTKIRYTYFKGTDLKDAWNNYIKYLHSLEKYISRN